MGPKRARGLASQVSTVVLALFAGTFVLTGCTSNHNDVASDTPSSTPTDMPLATTTIEPSTPSPTSTAIPPTESSMSTSTSTTVSPTGPAGATGPTITARSRALVYTAPRISALAIGTMPLGVPIQVLGRSDHDSEWLAIEGAGWVALADVELNPPDAELAAVSAADPRAAAPPHPHGSRTGVLPVDEIIALVEGMDVEGLMERVEVSLSRCGDPDEGEDGFWPCPEDPSAPKIREYVPIVACGGDRADASRMHDYITALFHPSYRGYQGDSSGEFSPLFVYAVTVPSGRGFTVALVYGAGTVIRWISTNGENRIDALGYGCDDHPVGEMIWPNSSYLLGPRVPSLLLQLGDQGKATTQ